ncbi:hemin uptake protein HemP [Dryocola clanedunensis]|uniref:hemin uptake protein HemP n=1 Tax=Enterobacteriaceae TaxID=543 RepID=UPI0038CBF4CB
MDRMDKPFTSTRPQPAAEPRHIDSKALLGSDGRVVIVHQGQQYLLRQTQAGKLILTK